MSNSKKNNTGSHSWSAFDLNNDGRTDFVEAALMYALWDEIMHNDKSSQKSTDRPDKIINIDDMDIPGI